MSRPPLRVAVLGAGTVGREVVRGLLDGSDRLRTTDGRPLALIGIACRDLARARAAGLPSDLLTDAPAHLVASPETDVVVELMGGDEPARMLIAAALGAGKPVVTANKHVLAHHGPALEGIARRAEVPLRFEAAVAGGIPVLGALADGLAANRIERVRGIVNGTTNFILSAMAEAGRPYADVLADAQAMGYAEADPTGDVEGDDAVNKLIILARLAFGAWLAPAAVGRRPPSARGFGVAGITGVTEGEIEGAAALGLTIKLFATANRTGEAGEGIAAGVIPTAVPATGPFGRTGGVTNRVEIEGEPVGTIALSGPGAGGATTSSAVLGDLVAVARGRGSTWGGALPAGAADGGVLDPFEAPRAWFTLLPGIDAAVVSPALPGAVVVAVPGGIAVRSASATVTDVRRELAGVLPPDTDATLYPVDD